MNDNERDAREWDGALERLAAEVTNTAYTVALRHGARGSWADLQLGLWDALARTVREWGHRPPAGEPSSFCNSASDRPQSGTVLHQEKE